jgi:hypothetical protein
LLLLPDARHAGGLSAALRTRLEELRQRYDDLSESLSADVRPPHAPHAATLPPPA